MAGAEDFEASNWYTKTHSHHRPKPLAVQSHGNAHPRPASVPRLAGQNIWKRPGLRSQDNKENEQAAQLELGKSGAGMRKRAKFEGGKEDIRDAMWMVADDDIEKVGSKEEKGRESLGRADLQIIGVTARKRTNADHVITPRKPLGKRASNETNIGSSPLKLIVSPEKPRRRKSVRKSLRRVSVTGETVEGRRDSLKRAAGFQTSGLGVVVELEVTTQTVTPGIAAEEPAEGPASEVTAEEGTLGSISDTQDLGAVGDNVDSVNGGIAAPEASESDQTIITCGIIMGHKDSDSTEIMDNVPDEHLLAAASVTSTAHQTSGEDQFNHEEDQLVKDSLVIATNEQSAKMQTTHEATASITITTPARATRSRRPATELRPNARASTRVTRRSLRQPDFPISGLLPATTSPFRKSRRVTCSPVKGVPLAVQEEKLESETTAQLSSEQQEPRPASPLKGIKELDLMDPGLSSTEFPQTNEPTMAERIDSEEAADAGDKVIQSTHVPVIGPVESPGVMAENTTAEGGEAPGRTFVEAELSKGDLTETSNEHNSSTPENDEELSQSDATVEAQTLASALPEDFTSSGDDLNSSALHSLEVLEPIALSILHVDSARDATDSEDELSADFTGDFTIDATIDLAADAAQDDTSTSVKEELTNTTIDITADVTQEVTHESAHANFDLDDTDVLLKFLTRVKGEKAAQAEKSTSKRKRSLPHSPIRLSLGEDDVDELASPEVVAKHEFDVSAPEESLGKRRKVEKSESRPQDGSPPRRSGRTKMLKSKLPAPNFIPIHRDATINLKKDAEKELAALTRNNTRKNKGVAVHPEVVVARKAAGKESPVSRHKALKEVFDEKANRKLGKKRKTVVWAEELAHFQGQDKTEIPVEKRIATIRIEKGEKKLEKKAEPVKDTEKEKADEPTVAFAPVSALEEKRTPAKKSSIPRVSMKSKIALGMAVNGTPAPKRMMRSRS